jgi:hypothetical protein
MSGKPVFRPLAENTDRVEWLNDRFGLFPSIEGQKRRGGQTLPYVSSPAERIGSRSKLAILSPLVPLQGRLLHGRYNRSHLLVKYLSQITSDFQREVR